MTRENRAIIERFPGILEALLGIKEIKPTEVGENMTIGEAYIISASKKYYNLYIDKRIYETQEWKKKNIPSLRRVTSK
jgi:hypothetical protein